MPIDAPLNRSHQAACLSGFCWLLVGLVWALPATAQSSLIGPPGSGFGDSLDSYSMAGYDTLDMAAQPQFLPLEILYPSYLAGPKEPRIGTQIFIERDDGALWDTTLGGRFGWLRGSDSLGRLWQADVEGAAILRLDPNEDIDLRSVDFRAGIPLTMAWGANRWKFAYYHLSAHIGDEYLIKNPTFNRLNYVRDALVLGYSRYFGERVRVYGEASWAFYHEISEPWQFQFGYEYAPTRPTGILGAPFFAINAQLREEVNYSGTTTLHAGWAWREPRAGRLLRAGFFLQTGKTHQYEFFDESETQIGAGLWYDF
ncbi:DUF1207 domain-containing protein [Planctomycetaceae bacterium SH139]